MGEGKKRVYEKIGGASPDLVKEHIEALKALFPEAVCEGKVDFEKLKAALGEELDERRERYSFTWAGKQDAIRLLQTPSRGTLVPAPEQSVNFDTTSHLFVEGDNLEVLKLLYKSYFGRVKMIYIDPPYNTGNDFIYPDNFTDPLDAYLKLTGQRDAEGNLLTSNPETSGRYHSAWLSMMYPRLFLARQLLREDGVIFVSIDDHEIHNLRMLMNEVFGEENFQATIIWQKKYSISNDDQGIADMHDYIVAFSRSGEFVRALLPRTEKQDARYLNLDDDPRGDWISDNYLSNKSSTQRPTLFYPIQHPKTKSEVWPPEHAVWRYSKEKHRRMVEENRLYWGPDQTYERPRLKRFKSEVKQGLVPSTWWPHVDAGHNDEANKELAQLLDLAGVFSSPKPTRLIKRLITIGLNGSEGTVLDFFAGSATTAQAVLDLNHEDGGNRRFILAQLPESTGRKDFPTIAEIGKERIRRVVAKLNKEDVEKLPKDHPEDLGFRVFKLAPSHHKLWAGVEEKEPGGYGEEMDLFKDPLLPGWTPENLIWDVALKEGFGLNAAVENLTSPRHGTFYRITDPDKDQHFILCLNEALHPDDLKALDLSKDDLFICRDIALTDELAANLALQCRLRTI